MLEGKACTHWLNLMQMALICCSLINGCEVRSFSLAVFARSGRQWVVVDNLGKGIEVSKDEVITSS